MGFKEQYLKMKEELKTDIEIAKEMGVSVSHIKKYKKLYNVPDVRKPRRNEQGLTEEELLKGERNGLSRRLMLQRVRLYRWRNELAITEPRKDNTSKRRKAYK